MPAIKLPQLPELKPRERLFATGSGVVLLILILDRLVLSPWFRQVQTIKTDTRQLEQALQHHSRLLARRGPIEAQAAAYQRYLHRPLPDELQTAMLIKELEGLAQQSRIEYPEIKPLAVQTDALSSHYPLDVVFECTLEQWVDFVIQIESSGSLFEIVRSSLTTNPDAPDRLKGSLRVVSTAMRQTDDAAPAAVPAAQPAQP